MAQPYSGLTGAACIVLESPYGTGTPVAADAIPIDPEKRIHELDAKPVDLHALRVSSLPPPPAFGLRSWKVAVETYFRNGGVAGTPSKCGRLLQAAGFKETDGASDDVYAPLASDGQSLGIAEYWGGWKFLSSGVRFEKGSIGGKVGEPLMGKFEGSGLYAAPTDSAIISSPVLDTTPPILVGIGGSFSFGGVALEIQEFSFEWVNQYLARIAYGAATGYAGFQIGGHKSAKAKIKANLESVADFPFFAAMLGETNKVWDQTLGTAAGNKVDIDLPRCRIVSPPKLSVEGGIGRVELEISAHDSTDNAANDWASIKLY